MPLRLGGVTRDQIKFARRCAERSFILTGPSGTRRSFDNLVDLARWAAANAFGKPDSEWLSIGQELK
jgi:hypothetical protein